MGHEYWRLKILANDGDADEVAVAEVQFRATVAGADQATGGTAISSVSGVGSASVTGAASQAFDDNTATNWSLSEAGRTWFPYCIGYDFASAVDVLEVAIISASSNATRSPTTFDVQWSDDGTTWVTYWTVTGSTGWSTGLTRAYAAPSYPAGVLATNLDGYAVTGTAVGVAVSQLDGYAVTGTGKGVVASSLAGYGVFLPPAASTARPVINIIV